MDHSLGVQYDNILMEESAQILEIETFIPLLLQVRCISVRLASLMPAYSVHVPVPECPRLNLSHLSTFKMLCLL